jgi:cytosine/adenosine deaminase-related metal-dependent hydrolase
LLKYEKRVVNRLSDEGGLGRKTILVHGVHLDMREYEIIRDSGSWLTHQPRSNMNNAVGVADIEGALRLGIPVALGNDGFSNNMYAEWKEAYLLHKIWHRDPRRANGMDIIQMAVHNNAKLAETFFPNDRPGYLEVGRAADLMMVDYHATTPLTAGSLPWHILFGFEASMITGTCSCSPRGP